MTDDNKEYSDGIEATYGISPKLQKQIQKLIDDETAQQKRTWSYYQKVRKENPQEYNKIRGQMTNDAIALGDKFKDGDFEDRKLF